MKKMMKTLVFVAAAAMGLTACQNDFEEQIEAKDSVVVTFVADSADSRTSVDTTGDVPVFAWAETGETFAVLEQTTALATASEFTYTYKDGKAKISATFDNNAGQAEYKYVTVYPQAGYYEAESINNATLCIPADQTMYSATSYDHNADLMVSKVVTTTAQPTEVKPLQFTRLAAVAKMSFRGFADAAEKVESVTFTTAEGVNIAGTFSTDLTNPVEFTTVDGVNSVTVTSPDGVSEVYFTLLPTTLEAGATYSVVVITDKKIYKKEATIPEGKSLEFAAGMVTRFGVDLTSATVSDKWVLVKDVNNLEAGDIVTFVTKDLNWAMGKHGGSYHYASYTEVVKMGDYFFHPIPTAANDGNNRVQQLIVVPRSGKENAFDFYHGVDYTGDTYKGFLCTSSQNNLKLQDYPTNNSLFYVEIDAESGVASVVATDSEISANNLKYRAYSGGKTTNNRRFVCTNTITEGEHYDICIYKMVGGKGDVPTPDAVITVPDEDEQPVVIAKEGATNEVFEGVTFPYVGDWTIEVSDNADWLEVYYANEQLTYTATANEGEVRNATVTITASHTGESDIVKTFNVVQKGAPKVVTVKEFSALPKDANAEYLVTGVMTTKGSGTSSITTLSDTEGNEADFKYIYMEGESSSSFYSNKDIAVGNVVTILASKSYSEDYGGSSSAHSICQGYYNISASATKDFVEYGGGSVEITIEKTGTLQPGTISGSVDGNFAELTANGDKYVLTLKANDGAPRQVVATFTDGYATTSVTVVQAADTSKGNTWELVTDASTLAVGDQVIITAKDYDVAMSTTISSDRRSEVSVTKLGNHFITPAEGTQTFVLGAGSEAKTFAFYDAVNEGYLVSTSKSSSSYYLKNQAYVDENTSFAISIVDGSATISNTAGDYSGNKLYYNQSKQYFYSGTSEKQTISLYRLVGVKGIIPVTPADVTVPEKHVVVVEQGVTEPTAISEVVFNYVGDWNITATSDVEWLTSLNYDKTNNCLNYTAAANEGVVRYATVTIKASLEGQDDITWTFSILQKGAPEEITIAEFITKPVDVNVEYKITGRVKVVPSSNSASATYEIEDADGNVAKATYLYTEAGSLVKTDDEIGLAVGDVVTITGPVSGSKGKIGSTSTYKSTYKGHYRLTATVEPTVVGYKGGDATISVALTQNGTLGTLCAPTAIEGNMPESDFATFSYTTDAPTATVNFAENAGASRKVEATFKSGLAEASVVVGQQNDPSVKVGWFLVKDVNELKEGDKVIIAAKNPDETLNYAISSTSSTSTFRPSIAISVTGECIDDVTGVQQYTLLSGHADYAGTWAFKGDSDNKYLYVSSGYLKVTSTLDNNGSWTIEIDSDGKVTFTSQTTNSKNTMMLNWTSSNQTFNVYAANTTGKGAIYIYKYYNSLEQ